MDALSSHLTIDSFFWTAIWGALILAIVSVCLQIVVGAFVKPEPRSRRAGSGLRRWCLALGRRCLRVVLAAPAVLLLGLGGRRWG